MRQALPLGQEECAVDIQHLRAIPAQRHLPSLALAYQQLPFTIQRQHGGRVLNRNALARLYQAFPTDIHGDDEARGNRRSHSVFRRYPRSVAILPCPRP